MVDKSLKASEIGWGEMPIIKFFDQQLIAKAYQRLKERDPKFKVFCENRKRMSISRITPRGMSYRKYLDE